MPDLHPNGAITFPYRQNGPVTNFTSTANTFTGLQTFTAGIDVSSGSITL